MELSVKKPLLYHLIALPFPSESHACIGSQLLEKAAEAVVSLLRVGGAFFQSVCRVLRWAASPGGNLF